MSAREDAIKKIIFPLTGSFSSQQLQDIENSIFVVLHDYSVTKNQDETALTTDMSPDVKAIQMFFISKRIDGRSDRTLRFYKYEIEEFYRFIMKQLNTVTVDDLRYYFATRKVSNTTMKNKRGVLSSFFTWLKNEDHIKTNPMLRVNTVKIEKKQKLPFSSEDIEKLKDACADKREKAIIDLLLSTGMRCGELHRSNIADVNFVTGEIKVVGKGNKERICYLNAAAKKHLQDYLNTRNDAYPALITSALNNGSRTKDNRLQISGIEILMRKIGKRAGVEKTHPHRFRRTAATMAISRGMPIEQVKLLLGHEQYDTTLKYAVVADDAVKYSHSKYF